ncbi:unnamed protein product [Vitrella brassicaformis CCMP3155]|uniref:V-SNARE coiled-coil homology domain-containing protein n=2 Tax=Vitrella brassicaformis TaxID=1169539 RepID=A0A0G4FAT4_VITBC|nr:unnamed protein product [Vitrella brassicaformis CCMP3155]|mmetsp:Transcript_39866/g.99752  ORF Transcript_39866/g.99752 Transcript_39866/m.99752 type:complete len:213 (+) Transcript_39866:105-743(+)|eukprot:CEM10022.1 unnamed protein product [Vitrella brassicaformis CCMP3155]
MAPRAGPHAIGLIVARCPPGDDTVIFLAAAHDVSCFPFLERSAMKETCNFLARTAIPHLVVDRRQSVEHEEEWVAHCLRYRDGIAIVFIASDEYPQRVAYKGVAQVREDFLEAYPSGEWRIAGRDFALSRSWNTELMGILKLYQDPTQVDALSRTQQKVDETKDIMHTTMKNILKRGENLDALVAKSDDLSASSKAFFKTAQKVNRRCCAIM